VDRDLKFRERGIKSVWKEGRAVKSVCSNLWQLGTYTSKAIQLVAEIDVIFRQNHDFAYSRPKMKRYT